MIPIELRELLHNLKDREWDTLPTYSIDENEGKKIIAAIEEADKEQSTVNISPNNPVDGFLCEKCGFEAEDWSAIERDEEYQDMNYYEFEFKYCPRCGKKVIDYQPTDVL